MNKVYFCPETDGFYGVYYPNEKATGKDMIVMLGDSSDDRMAVSGVMVWVFRAGIQHPKECRKTRVDIDRRTTASIKAWQQG